MDSSNFIQALKKYDYYFFGISLAIFIMGIFNLYSATHASASDAMASLYKTQIGYFFLSLLIGVGVSFIQPKTLFRYTYVLYFICVALLVAVLVIGDVGMGAQRWIVIGNIRFQPSELTKIVVILTIARWFAAHEPDRELGLKELIPPFLLALIPALLTIVEPDLGTGLLMLLIFFVMAFYRKLKWRTILVLGIVGVISSGVMYQFGLREYQKKRVINFIDPTQDAKGSGYNAIQSKIAIGSGRLLGKGYKKSSQASLNYLPENHTDFVFSIFNEEHGLFGSLFLISLYLILFHRFIWLAGAVPRMFDSVVAIGLMSIFFWHTFVNMGMVMGMLPIVGLPLPYMSYGGTSLLTFGVCCGIATSLSNARNLF